MQKLTPTMIQNIQNIQLILLGFCHICLYLLLGQWLSSLIPLPSAIKGLVICTSVCFILKKVPLPLELASNFLLKNMAIFFIPYVVTITLFWPELKEYWLVCLAALLLSTLVTLAITSLLCDKLVERAAILAKTRTKNDNAYANDDNINVHPHDGNLFSH
jgi:holin-like protein